jgi:hypothetical protein
MQTSIPHFKAALKARLEADATLIAAGGSVSRGNPHPGAWPAKLVIIGAVSGWTLAFACGMTQVNEEYDLEVVATFAGSPQNSSALYEDGAYALMVPVLTSLVSWMDGNPLVSGAWGHVGAAIPQPAGDAEGFEVDANGVPVARDSTVSVSVHVTARLV